MTRKIQKFNETLIRDLENTGTHSFQEVLRLVNKKQIVMDSDQILVYKETEQ